jgi:Trypsin
MFLVKKKIYWLILLLCAQAQALIHSNIAEKEQVPAAMQIWLMQENQLKFRCSGTLVAPDVVITEASCIYDQNHQRRSGTFLISNSAKTDFSKPLSDILQRVLATVRSEVRHPSENLVILYLKQAVSIKPAVLLQPNEAHQLINPGPSFVAGWGISKVSEGYSWFEKAQHFLGKNEMRQLNIKHLGITHIGGNTEHLLEFGQQPGDAVGCTGDEGGPIVINIQTSFANTERLVGIISSHANLDHCDSPTYAMRLDTLFNFIHEQLILGCQKGYRIWCHVQGLLPPSFEEEDTPEVIPAEPKFLPPNTAPPPPVPLSTESKKEKKESNKNLKIRMESMGCNCLKVRKR